MAKNKNLNNSTAKANLTFLWGNIQTGTYSQQIYLKCKDESILTLYWLKK